MITISGVYRSRATRPLWLLGELGLPFTHVPVIQAYRLSDPLAEDAQINTASPAFRALNPQGTIPVMEEDGLVLTESLAITLHIARRHGGDLAPQGEAEAAETDQWMLFGATALEEPGLDLMFTLQRGEAETPEGKARIVAAEAALERPLARLEVHLEEREWLVGGRFTVADLMVAECLRYGQTHGALLEGFPRVRGWIGRCQARPAFQDMMTKRAAEPA